MTDNNNNSNNNTTNTPTEQERQRTLPNILHGLFPFSFVIRQNTNNNNNVQNSGQGRTANEQTNDNSNNGGNNNNNNNVEQEIRFFMMPFPPTGNDDSIPIIFFTPVFMAPPEPRKPRASEKTMKELPIVKITKEHVESSASCSICLEHFRMSKTDDDDVNNVENMITNDEKFDTSNNKNAENEKSNVVRKMPCEHMFCETCLFEWLRQNNTCPLCRYELPAEGQEQESNNNNVNNNDNDVNMANSNSNDDEPSVRSTTNIRSSYNTDEESSASTSTTTTTSPLPSPLNQHNHQNVGCAFAELGMCEVANNAQNRNNDNNDNNGDDVVGSLSSMIITLPQCRHRFHASCLRTTLLISGYSLESNTLDLRCPICRVRSILRENLLKVLNNHSFPPTSTTTTTSLPQQNGQITTTTTSSSSLPHITAPYVIHFNDEMDLD